MKNIYNKVVPFPSFQIYRSEIDGCIVVHVDTGEIPENEHGPIIRVYLNDGILFENPSLPREGEAALDELVKIAQENDMGYSK